MYEEKLALNKCVEVLQVVFMLLLRYSTRTGLAAYVEPNAAVGTWNLGVWASNFKLEAL